MTRIEGFDYLRVIMSFFVVLLHMETLDQSLIFSQSEYVQHKFLFTDFLHFHLLLMAVPTFIFVSCFLYARSEASFNLLQRRVGRIFVLLITWPIAFILYKKGYQGFAEITPGSANDLIETLLRAGNTSYYFFVSLIVCILITHLATERSVRFNVTALVLSVLMLVALPAASAVMGINQLSAYWNPLNFVPIIFAATLLAKCFDFFLLHRAKLIVGSVVLCGLFSALEWTFFVDDAHFYGQGYALPAYTRASLLFGVIAIVSLVMTPKIKTNAPISFMSQYALALYCLHPFLILPVTRCVDSLLADTIWCRLISFVLVISASYVAAIFLRRYFVKEELVV